MPRGGRRPGAGAPRGNTNAIKHGLRSPRARAIAQALAAGVLPRNLAPEALARLTRRRADPAALRALRAAAHRFTTSYATGATAAELEAVAVLLAAAGIPGGISELAAGLAERLAAVRAAIAAGTFDPALGLDPLEDTQTIRGGLDRRYIVRSCFEAISHALTKLSVDTTLLGRWPNGRNVARSAPHGSGRPCMQIRGVRTEICKASVPI